jgi:hypothetical protein
MAATVHQLPVGGRPMQMTDGYASSFGPDQTTQGPQIDARGLMDSDRVKELEFRERFYRCTQHDRKMFDFDGRLIMPGKVAGVQPLIGGSVPSFYVPMTSRRPSAPYRIGKKIVGSFTAMLFGRGRFPQPRSNDPATQDWAEEVVRATKLRNRIIRARNIGGSCGTVALSWRIYEGEVRISVHHGKHVHVLEWEDYEERIVGHAVELYQVQRRVPDERTGKPVERWFWRRRDWTTTADVFYQLAEVSDDPTWVVDDARSSEHGDGEAHIAWIENLPDDEEASEDGLSDYDGTYEQMNVLDMLNSVVCKGGVLNLDPTLKLKMDPDDVGRAVIRKGSENAIITGMGGDADYLELSGTSIQAGLALIEKQKEQTLEVNECVLTDPDKVAAAGTSSVALKVVYAPMIGKSDLMRESYGDGIQRVLNGIARAVRRWTPNPEAETDEERYVHEPVAGETDGEEQLEPVEYGLKLRPRIEIDDEGNRTEIPRHPGRGSIELEWGPYFKPTADDHQKDAQAAGTAAGGKPVMSQQTAVEIVAQSYDRDGAEEWRRVRQEAQEQATLEGEMFPGTGGEVDGEAAPVGRSDGVELTATDISKIVTVNEARRGQGLAELVLPDGGRDPDGELTVAEFVKRREEAAKGEQKLAVEQVKAKAAADSAGVGSELGPAVELTATDSAKIVTVREARAGKGLLPLKLADGSDDPDMDLTVEEYTTKRKEQAQARADIQVEEAKKGSPGGSPPPTGGAPVGG